MRIKARKIKNRQTDGKWNEKAQVKWNHVQQLHKYKHHKLPWKPKTNKIKLESLTCDRCSGFQHVLWTSNTQPPPEPKTLNRPAVRKTQNTQKYKRQTIKKTKRYHSNRYNINKLKNKTNHKNKQKTTTITHSKVKKSKNQKIKKLA